MNLYIYVKPSDLTQTQMRALEKSFSKVVVTDDNNYELLYEDNEPKVVALDPDIVGWKFENEVIDRIPQLRAICLETTGYEWIDSEYCAKKDIAVTNVPHYATNAVAEKCVMMALSLAKKLPLFQKAGGMNWDDEFIGEEMWDKPTDIVGFGEIGQSLARKLDGIVGRKEICYYQRHQVETPYHYLSFEEMLAASEYMFITAAKNPESLALFNDLSKFNKNMKIIIVANGFEDVAERMAKMVGEGQLGGVAFESDDLGKSYDRNVFITPHNAYYTKEALEQMFEIWVKTVLSVTGEIINRVN